MSHVTFGRWEREEKRDKTRELSFALGQTVEHRDERAAGLDENKTLKTRTEAK